MKTNLFNVNKFFKRSPKLGYQFKVEFYIKALNDDGTIEKYDNQSYISRALSTCVQSVTIPNAKIKSTPYVGNYLYNNIEYDFSDMSLNVVFEENDDMLVNKLIMHLLTNQRPSICFIDEDENNKTYPSYSFLSNSYMNTFENNGGQFELINFLDIHVFEMNPNKNNTNNYKSSIVHVFRDCYVIKNENVNMEYTESPKGVTMNIEFGFKQYYIAKLGMIGDINESLEKTNTEDEEIIRNKTLSELEYQSELTENINSKGTTLGTTKDFYVTDEEIDALYNQLNDANIDKEAFTQMSRANADLMKKAYSTFQNKLNEYGIEISVNDYNGTGHANGLGTESGSHTLSQKVDLNIKRADGTKVTRENATKDERELIERLADESELIINFEKGNNDDSLWADTSLKEAFTLSDDGKKVEKKTMKRWVEKDRIHEEITEVRDSKNVVVKKGTIDFKL